MMSEEAQPKRVTQAELARLLGVSRTAVSKAAKSGRITAGEDSHFDLEKALTDWKNNTRAAVKAATGSGSSRLRGGQPKYASARARKEHHLANIAAMREQQMLGELCKTSDVVSAGNEIGIVIRFHLDALLNSLPGEIAHHDIDDVAEILGNKFIELLQGISADLEKRIKEAVRPEEPSGRQ